MEALEPFVIEHGSECKDDGGPPPRSATLGKSLLASLVPSQILAEIPFLRRAVRRWYGADADADDLVQDTLTRALASAHQWEPGSDIRAWLFIIMRNRFLEVRGREKKAVLAIQGYAESTSGRQVQNTDVRLTLRDVQRTLARMPKVQSMALMLVGVEGKSYEEVAHDMKVSIDSVRCHLSRARARLREAVLAEEETTPFTRTATAAGPKGAKTNSPRKARRR